MTDKPNATLTEESVWEILKRLRRIEQGNPDSDTQSDIARTYGVEKKTISRIKNGKTWRTIKQRFDEHPTNRVEIAPVVRLTPDSDDIQDLMDLTTAAKNQFSLDHNRPLHFGRFDWIDGLHYVATDGLIMWESRSLFGLAEQIEATGVKKHPLFAGKASELATLEISEMMTLPINEEFVERDDFATGVSKLVSEEGKVVFLRECYMRVVDKNKFQIHMAGDQLNFVYLTKSIVKHKKIENADPVVVSETIVIHALVATMETPCQVK